MSIIRVRKDSRYFTTSNEPFNDKRLRWETRGLLAYLFSKPDNWQIRLSDLEAKGPAKLHKLKQMLRDAQKHGYMNRYRMVRQDGTFYWLSEVYESPSMNPQPQTSGGFSTSGLSTSGKSHDVVITEEVITEERFAAIVKKLEELSGGLNSDTPAMVDTWMEKHTNEWIFKAIDIAIQKRARSPKYVDEILIGWEANGYPQTREQRVKGKKTTTPPAPKESDEELARRRAEADKVFGVTS